LFCSFLGYVLAPPTSFPVAVQNGEGMRNLYIPWALFSVWLGLSLAHRPLRLGLLTVCLLLALSGQWRLMSAWQYAGEQMRAITDAVPALAASVEEKAYALVLLPDHVGPVPFARNAQGGVVMPPRQAKSYLYKLAGMTPLQFEEWEEHLATNRIGSLKKPAGTFDRSAFAGVYCWLPRDRRFQLLDAMPQEGDAVAWQEATLAEAAERGCLLGEERGRGGQG